MEILKVSAQSDASATAGALANTIRESGEAELQGIGPKAINQAVKAIAIARSYLASSGVDLVSMPSFVDVEIDGEQRTALRFTITPRHRLHQPHEDGHPVDKEPEGGERDELVGSERDHDREPESEREVTTESEPAEEEPRPRPRPTSLSEAITGRPASELADEDADSANEREGSATSDDTAEDEDRSDEDETEQRSSFLGRSRRSAFDTDRDVF